MRAFTVDASDNPRVEYDPSKEEFVERHEQAFLLIGDTKEEHDAILDLLKRYTIIDDDIEVKP